MNSRKCLLLVVDALSHRVLEQRFEKGELKNVHELILRGGALRPCTSIFPSITPAATCSIVTGCYPSQHGIEGACWLDEESNELVYYGDDLSLAFKRGFHKYLIDFGDQLNYERLQCPTIFEELEESGLETACINYLWFAGPHEHARVTPLTLRLLAGKMPGTVRGPKYLKLGDFVETLPDGVAKSSASGVLHRYGFDDDVTTDCLLRIANAGKLPKFTLAYFPSNDDVSHEKGPDASAGTVLIQFDKFFGELIESLGGWGNALEHVDIIIVGDHAQNGFTHQRDPNVIKLDDWLKEFQQADPGKVWQGNDELLICPNMRAAAIYLRDDSPVLAARVRERLLTHSLIDQVIERDGGEKAWKVSTADRGSLRFELQDQKTGSSVQDAYGNHWILSGDCACIDAIVDHGGLIEYGSYPNALERIANAFTDGASPIWVSAKEDSEIRIAESTTHPGGSHASLHEVDSCAAMVVSSGVDLSCLVCPAHPRIVDVARLVKASVGIYLGLSG